MLIGLGAGAVGISFGMSVLFKKFYTVTFSAIFGMFLSMIPNMLSEQCVLGMNMASAVSIVVMIVGFGVSYYLGDIEKNNQRLKKIFSSEK